MRCTPSMTNTISRYLSLDSVWYPEFCRSVILLQNILVLEVGVKVIQDNTKLISLENYILSYFHRTSVISPLRKVPGVEYDL